MIKDKNLIKSTYVNYKIIRYKSRFKKDKDNITEIISGIYSFPNIQDKIIFQSNYNTTMYGIKFEMIIKIIKSNQGFIEMKYRDKYNAGIVRDKDDIFKQTKTFIL